MFQAACASHLAFLSFTLSIYCFIHNVIIFLQEKYANFNGGRRSKQCRKGNERKKVFKMKVSTFDDNMPVQAFSSVWLSLVAMAMARR